MLLKYARSLDTFRFALFLGSFVGGFKALNCVVRARRKVEDGWNAFIAGSIAGLAILLDYRHRRTAIALYLSTRSLQFAVTALARRKVIPTVPHADSLVMGLASSQIIYAYTAAQSTLPKQYLDFLKVHGGLTHRFPKQENDVFALFKAVYESNEPAALELMKKPFFPANPLPDRKLCQMMHPHTTNCNQFHREFFLESIPRSLRLYVPLNVATGLIFRYKHLLKKYVLL